MQALIKLIKYILFHNLWSFLFVLSGIVDMLIAVVLLFSDWLDPDEPKITVFIICFAVGIVYFAIGVIIALVYSRRQENRE
jgi:hypothetical protein